MQLLLLSSLLATAVLAEVPTAAHQEIAGDAIARPVLITSVAPVSTPTLSFTTSLASEVTTKKAGVLCQLCIDEVLALINEVLNDILNGVILNSCGKLCNGIKNNATKELCTVACDVVGIKKLVEYLNSTDPDEIYICSEIKLCEMGNCTGHGDGSSCLDITSLTAPPVVTIDAAVNVIAAINVTEPLATGMTRIQIIFPPDKKGQSQVQQTDQLNLNWPAGVQSLEVQIPSGTLAGVGNYSVSVEVCEGSCGSIKPHTSVYDKKDVKFEAVRHGPGPGPTPPPPPGPPAPPAPPGSTHYGDPSHGPCLSDEEKVQITGLAGDFCSPKCSGSTCPSDLPTGTTAQPRCVLETSGSKTPTQCALMCKGAGATGCPDGASCKAIQGLGICTYND